MNFVILNWIIGEDREFARSLGFSYHPQYAAIAPNSKAFVNRLFAEPRSGELRNMIEALLAEHGGES